jgi:hypothetical protein
VSLVEVGAILRGGWWVLRGEGGIFERRGRKGYAEGAKRGAKEENSNTAAKGAKLREVRERTAKKDKKIKR